MLRKGDEKGAILQQDAREATIYTLPGILAQRNKTYPLYFLRYSTASLGISKLHYYPPHSIVITACTLQDALEADMKVFSHLLYEYEKGIRSLLLYTIPCHLLPLAEGKLEKRQIDFFVQPVRNRDSVNIFFGQSDCITTMKCLLRGKTIDDLSPEEDFILGALLGYDLSKQCQRYCQRIDKRQTVLAKAI